MAYVVGIVLIIVACVFILSRMNEVEDKEEKRKQDRELNNAEAIRKYKELLDDGIISQEEFDKKKETLLQNKWLFALDKAKEVELMVESNIDNPFSCGK